MVNIKQRVHPDLKTALMLKVKNKAKVLNAQMQTNLQQNMQKIIQHKILKSTIYFVHVHCPNLVPYVLKEAWKVSYHMNKDDPGLILK